MEEELKKLIGEGEKIFYEGKPSKKCFIFESIFNPMMPFAILWGLIDSTFIGATLFAGSGEGGGFLLFIIPFFLLHLMPVWLYLGGVVLSFRRYRNTYYIVTDKGIYISGGAFTKTFNQKPFAELSHVDLHRGIFDQIFNVGDVITTSSNFTVDSRTAALAINSIDNYVEVYNIVKKLQQDIYTDVMYPNDKRPAENHGYNTEYKG
ncbi:MAG: PH domain-containing protein [Bacilli bacterium]|nr:PH domain-containing protein [Bacilli bacterium]